MNKRDVQKLRHGCYIIYWKGGGASYATVGSLHDGRRWLAPANWTSACVTGIATTAAWWKVAKVEAIVAPGLPK